MQKGSGNRTRSLLIASNAVCTSAIVKAYVDKKLGKFTVADVLINCPSVGRTSVFNVLKKLTDEEYIEKHGERKSAFFVKKNTNVW